ncbi:uncharacterized protein LOC131687460 [Topomyia yanbarensis]|uniref:uncharacterized protein LOC131687460 n=1 Tax=Topomyia yanbarensis TaxID=2498891 RepID=UPI00273C56B8|nr:uncharacterized protein LOC131687460 [Topomyia yanbarensis]
MSMIKVTPPKKRPVRSNAAKLKTLMRQRANIFGSAALIKKFNDQFREGQGHQVQVGIDSLAQLWAGFASVQDDIEEIEDRVDGESEVEATLSDERIQFQDLYFDLKASLAAFRGEAARIVANLEVNAAKFTIAWKSVCERYDNPNLLLKHHFATLFTIPNVKKASSSALYDLVDEFDHHVGILEKLDTPANLWNTVLVESLSKRLDPVTLKEWENNCEGDARPTYQNLIDFVLKTSRVLQSVKLLHNCNQPVDLKPVRPKPISSHITTETTFKCKHAHPLFKCDQFLGMEAKQRFEFVKKHGLCINCLKGSHLAKNCSSSCCRNCSKKHHTLLHLPPLHTGHKPATQTSLACSAVTSDVIPSGQLLSHTSLFASQSCPSPPPSQVVSRAMDSVSAYTYSVVVAPSPPPVGSSVSYSIGSSAVDQNTLPMAAYVAPKKDSVGCTGEVFLSTVVVKVKGTTGGSHFIRGVLDSCSQANFISEAMARRLELKRDNINMQVSGIGQEIVHIRSKVHIKISSRFGKFDYHLECLVIPQITVTIPSNHVDISRWNIPDNIPLADPRFNISAGVDLLIGAELFYSLLESHKVRLSEGYPTLQQTVFGYVVVGKLLESANPSLICIVSASRSLETTSHRFLEVENFDDGKSMTPLEQVCEDHFKKNVSRANGGRYMVRLPVREELLPLLGESYAVAQRRLLAIERKFTLNSEFKREYVDFMEEYRNLGHMELSARIEHPQFFLPHHAIHRPESSTTKTRVVFDATCKGSTQMSLNDVLLVGPIVQPSLLATVLNFRAPKFVFIADIEKMFRQVWVHPTDRKLQQILWRSNASQPLQRYQLTTITYGTSSAPYLATRVLNQLAEDEGRRFPLGAGIIRKGFYVDDVLTGSDDLDELIEASKQLSQLLELGGFRLRKWCANDAQIIRHIPDDLKESLPLTEIDRSTAVKTLGLLWSHDSDEFGFKIPGLPELSSFTKRVVLSKMAQLFDPLGLVGAVIVSAKIFVQQLWAMNLSWDEELR